MMHTRDGRKPEPDGETRNPTKFGSSYTISGRGRVTGKLSGIFWVRVRGKVSPSRPVPDIYNINKIIFYIYMI